MTQTVTYKEQQFIEDIRQAFASSDDPRDQSHTIAEHLCRMLAQPGWLEGSSTFNGKYGKTVIHSDEAYGHPSSGFMVLAYRNPPRPENQTASPHDHGTCFVVYG